MALEYRSLFPRNKHTKVVDSPECALHKHTVILNPSPTKDKLSAKKHMLSGEWVYCGRTIMLPSCCQHKHLQFISIHSLCCSSNDSGTHVQPQKIIPLMLQSCQPVCVQSLLSFWHGFYDMLLPDVQKENSCRFRILFVVRFSYW